MKTTFRRAARLAVIGTCLGATLGVAATPASAAPAATAVAEGSTPPANLASGASVLVSVSGFDGPGLGLLTMVECPVTATAIATCVLKETQDLMVLDPPTGAGGDLPGTGTSPFTVAIVPGICDATHACAIFVLENPDNFGTAPGDRFAKAEFTFAGSGSVNDDEPPAVVPELGRTILLPLAAAALLGVLIARHRHAPDQAA